MDSIQSSSILQWEDLQSKGQQLELTKRINEALIPSKASEENIETRLSQSFLGQTHQPKVSPISAQAIKSPAIADGEVGK